jgi:hypothetical protein
MGTWLIAGGRKGVRKERKGNWDLVGGWGAVTRCVTHEAERGGKAAHNDCQNVERALGEIAENSVPKHMIEEFAVSLLHRKRVSRMPCRHSLFFLSYLQYQFWYSPIGLPRGRRTSWITWSRCFSVDEVIISRFL